MREIWVRYGVPALCKLQEEKDCVRNGQLGIQRRGKD